MSGIKYGKRYFPEGEGLGSKYGLEERSIFGVSALVMALGKTLVSVCNNHV